MFCEYVIKFWDGEYLENWAPAAKLNYTTQNINQACTFTYKGAEAFIAERGWKDAEIVKVL